MQICFLISILVQFAHYTASPTGSDPLISADVKTEGNTTPSSNSQDLENKQPVSSTGNKDADYLAIFGLTENEHPEAPYEFDF